MIRDRFPGSDILAQRGHWDDATRRVVLDRVHNIPPFRFFDEDEQRTLEALCERVLPQPGRPAARRVRIAPWIDERCSNEAHEGFRFDDMPPGPEAWRLGLRGLDETARALHGAPFAVLSDGHQGEVLDSVRRGEPPGATWRTLPPRRWWMQVALREITGVYYAHPTAWDEIGFGGPAYPRGYASLNRGAPEPWEAREDLGARAADEAERRAAATAPRTAEPDAEAGPAATSAATSDAPARRSIGAAE